MGRGEKYNTVLFGGGGVKKNYRVQSLKCCEICKFSDPYVFEKDLCCNLDNTKPNNPQLLKLWEVEHEVDWKGICDDYEYYEADE